IRGDRKVRKTGSDVLSFNVPDSREHGAGKPPELYSEILSWIAFPGDCVLDPCAGSGTIIQAADLLDLSAIAIEKDPAFATLIQEKIEETLK
ncbi:MAG: DNA methyltransferase, partial [Minisyncoccia bacterium]